MWSSGKVIIYGFPVKIIARDKICLFQSLGKSLRDDQGQDKSGTKCQRFQLPRTIGQVESEKNTNILFYLF